MIRVRECTRGTRCRVVRIGIAGIDKLQQHLILRGKLVSQHPLDIIVRYVHLRCNAEKLHFVLQITLPCTDNERPIAPDGSFEKCVEVSHAHAYLASHPISASFPVFNIDHGAHLVSVSRAETPVIKSIFLIMSTSKIPMLTLGASLTWYGSYTSVPSIKTRFSFSSPP